MKTYRHIFTRSVIVCCLACYCRTSKWNFLGLKVLVFFFTSLLFSCKEIVPLASISTGSEISAPEKIHYQILNTYPHDDDAFTQGLQFVNGKLYEGTGNYEKSSVRIVDVKTGKPDKKHVMGSADIFGEGITLFKGQLFQLTWQSNIVYVYNPSDITKVVKTHTWPREGWGITHDGTHLIISDGSAHLYVVDPETFAILKMVTVIGPKGPVRYLNELEFIDGFIFANVLGSDKIIKIDPSNGHIVGVMHCEGLLKYYYPNYIPSPYNVLNGIAWDNTNKTIYITGKRWPLVFEIALK